MRAHGVYCKKSGSPGREQAGNQYRTACCPCSARSLRMNENRIKYTSEMRRNSLRGRPLRSVSAGGCRLSGTLAALPAARPPRRRALSQPPESTGFPSVLRALSPSRSGKGRGDGAALLPHCLILSCPPGHIPSQKGSARSGRAFFAVNPPRIREGWGQSAWRRTKTFWRRETAFQRTGPPRRWCGTEAGPDPGQPPCWGAPGAAWPGTC